MDEATFLLKILWKSDDHPSPCSRRRRVTRTLRVTSMKSAETMPGLVQRHSLRCTSLRCTSLRRPSLLGRWCFGHCSLHAFHTVETATEFHLRRCALLPPSASTSPRHPSSPSGIMHVPILHEALNTSVHCIIAYTCYCATTPPPFRPPSQ